MITWSFTGSKAFDRCQRQWFYKNFVANAQAKKDLFRREAYILSKLQTVDAWRGHLVDHIISTEIVPLLQRGGFPRETSIISAARDLFEKQKAFALDHRIRDAGFSQTGAADSFAAFAAIEYGESVTDDSLNQAWEDTRLALSNLLGMRDLLDDLRQAARLVAQRTLSFSIFEARGEARPDLIAIYRERAPLIADWKVHTFGTNDYRRQLVAYAVALERCAPHKDFAEFWRDWGATQMRLIEVQLLTRKIREYRVSEADVDEMEDTIVESHARMSLAVGREVSDGLDPFALPEARYDGICAKCNFRRPCLEEVRCLESKQMTLLFPI
jgi:hypothetical protein